MVRKIGENEGSTETSTSIDYMKPWKDNTEYWSNEENDEECYEKEDIDI